MPIPKGNWQETVLPKCREIADALRAAGIRVMLDDRDAYTPGWKYAEWELRGVPLRLEVGPRDIQNNQVFSSRRDMKAKAPLPIDGLPAAVRALLDTDPGRRSRRRSRTFREEHTTRVDTYDEFKAAMDGRPGFVVAPWAHNAANEAQVKTDTQATLRNVPFSVKAAMDGRPGFVVVPWAHDAANEAQVKTDTQATLRNVPFSEGTPEGKRCMFSGAPADVYAYFAKAY